MSSDSLDDGRPPERASSLATEFPLAGYAYDRLIPAAVLAASAASIIGLWIVFGLGGLGLATALTGSVAMAVSGGLFLWFLLGRRSMIARFTPDHLAVKIGFDWVNYRWEHITGVAVARLKPLRVLGVPLESGGAGAVRIRLNRSLRAGLRAGTDVPGIPIVRSKTVDLRLDDPHGFVEAIRAFRGWPDSANASA